MSGAHGHSTAPNSMDNFAAAVLAWFANHGRKNLPWQKHVTPYRVWVSEIMLQQTQVTTVVGYYERFIQRFIQRFPTLQALADAPLDDVLHHWSGLGYYARARNLHKTASLVCATASKTLPEDIEELTALPGIGRSTAGAILTLANGQRHAILDGNVKRVLSRYHAVEGWAGRAAVSKQLWHLAQTHTPDVEVASYTQAMMDLGATVCKRTRPACDRCPLSVGCKALALGTPTNFPTPKPKSEKPSKTTIFLIVMNADNHVLLQRRPPSGIWGGLWSFPECAPDEQPCEALACALNLQASVQVRLEAIYHGFTHFQLTISPVVLRLDETASQVCVALGDKRSIWYDIDNPPSIGLAAPVASLLASLQHLSDTV